MSMRPSTESVTSGLDLRSRYFKVDLALDATPHSQTLVDHLHRYAESSHTTCQLLYALPATDEAGGKFSAFDEEASQELARLVGDRFEQYAARLQAMGVSVQERQFIRDGKTVEDSILGFVEADTPDLLVLGMHDARPVHRKGWQISSTSYSIATHAPCSVLVIKRAPQQADTLKVLFATDGSEHAEKAAKDLIEFLPRGAAEISVLNVVSVNYYVLPVVEPYVDYSALENAMKGTATELVERTGAFFEEAGYVVKNSSFTLGDPVEQILQEASSGGYDLVVMGSHGAGGRLTSWLLGSVSSKVLEYTEASVAILK